MPPLPDLLPDLKRREARLRNNAALMGDFRLGLLMAGYEETAVAVVTGAVQAHRKAVALELPHCSEIAAREILVAVRVLTQLHREITQ